MVAILVQPWLGLVFGTLIPLHVHREDAQVLLLRGHFITQEGRLKIWTTRVDRRERPNIHNALAFIRLRLYSLRTRIGRAHLGWASWFLVVEDDSLIVLRNMVLICATKSGISKAYLMLLFLLLR